MSFLTCQLLLSYGQFVLVTGMAVFPENYAPDIQEDASRMIIFQKNILLINTTVKLNQFDYKT